MARVRLRRAYLTLTLTHPHPHPHPNPNPHPSPNPHQARLRRVYLATDSPRPELFEDVLRHHGVSFARYGQQGPSPSLGEEFELPVDQVLCAAAPYFLGNVPSTVTATIVQERDNAGHPRTTTDFFGFEPSELEQFQAGWEPTSDFAC